jgi:hypothetical protein
MAHPPRQLEMVQLAEVQVNASQPPCVQSTLQVDKGAHVKGWQLPAEQSRLHVD